MREITRRPRFVGAIATRLSGLSETSWGDGRDKRTVVHAKCLEDNPFGRVLRKKGSFLCLPAWTPWDVSEKDQGDVNCPRCVRILARLDARGKLWFTADPPSGGSAALYFICCDARL